MPIEEEEEEGLYRAIHSSVKIINVSVGPRGEFSHCGVENITSIFTKGTVERKHFHSKKRGMFCASQQNSYLQLTSTLFEQSKEKSHIGAFVFLRLKFYSFN